MNLRFPPRNYAISAKSVDFHSTKISYTTTQAISSAKSGTEVFISKLLDRKWTLAKPDTQIHQISLSGTQFSNNSSPSFGERLREKNSENQSFYVVRDDLLHPLANGNKSRKLDALIPLIEDHAATDVVTCGGCQSAHTAALAVLCAERGLRSHLLLRGEKPEVSTGYNLISALYGNVTYVPRSIYAKREEMLEKHADVVAGSSGSVLSLSSILEASLSQISSKSGSQRLEPDRFAGNPKKVVIVNEGAGDAAALLGVIRLVQYLSQNHNFGKDQPIKLLVDSGTGTTAIGLGIGAKCLGLPWEIHAVMLADSIAGYRRQEQRLVSEFLRFYDFPGVDQLLNSSDGELVHWLERNEPRRFGNVLAGEVKECQRIAQQTGVLVDPIYTLAAWQLAAEMSGEEDEGGARIVMLHTGGTLGMFGLAQRYKPFFDTL